MEKVYLLLRNNVESGPFTYAQLQKQSLKSSDLIWIEGESNAWLNPKELADNKQIKNGALSIAPVSACVPHRSHVPKPHLSAKTPKPPASFAQKNLLGRATASKKATSFQQERILSREEELIDLRVHKKGMRMVSLDQLAAVAFIALVATTAWYGRHQFFAGKQQTISTAAPVAFVSEESFAAKEQVVPPVNISPLNDTVASTPVTFNQKEASKSKARGLPVQTIREHKPVTEPVINEIVQVVSPPSPMQKETESKITTPAKEAPSPDLIERKVPEKELVEVASQSEEGTESKKKKSLGKAIKGIFQKKKNASESLENDQ